jgi:hypothetical protein
MCIWQAASMIVPRSPKLLSGVSLLVDKALPLFVAAIRTPALQTFIVAYRDAQFPACMPDA